MITNKNKLKSRLVGKKKFFFSRHYVYDVTCEEGVSNLAVNS